MFKDIDRYREVARSSLGETFSTSEVKDTGVLLHTLIAPDSSKSARFEAALGLIRGALPTDISQAVAGKWGYRFRSYPFSQATHTLIPEKFGEGGINRVFLLESTAADKSSWVVKLPKIRTGKPPEEYIREQREEVSEIQHYFADLTNFVIPEHYIIMEGRDGKPTAASLQEYQGKVKDPFEEYSEGDLKDLLRERPDLREEFSTFLATLDTHSELIEKEFDILGLRNLVIAEESGEFHLRLMDPHYRSKPSHSDEAKLRISDRVDYIRRILSDLSIPENGT